MQAHLGRCRHLHCAYGRRTGVVGAGVGVARAHPCLRSPKKRDTSLQRHFGAGETAHAVAGRGRQRSCSPALPRRTVSTETERNRASPSPWNAIKRPVAPCVHHVAAMGLSILETLPSSPVTSLRLGSSRTPPAGKKKMCPTTCGTWPPSLCVSWAPRRTYGHARVSHGISHRWFRMSCHNPPLARTLASSPSAREPCQPRKIGSGRVRSYGGW